METGKPGITDRDSATCVETNTVHKFQEVFLCMHRTKQPPYSSPLRMLLQQQAISGNASKCPADIATIPSSDIPDADKTSRYKSIKLIGLHPLCAVMFTIGY